MARPVSVVVNTYNRAASLRLTLESLSQLDYPTFEVVVVNGPSQDGTESVLEEFADWIKIGHCENTNLSESRNIGVAMAAGEIVAFIDDDAYPDPAWLDRVVEGYDADEVAAVGGPVYDHTGVALQARYTFGTRLGDARVGFEKVNPTEFLNSPWTQEFVNTLGTNSSFRRDRLMEIGGFDEEFEYYLDENSVCCRLVDRGYVVRALDDGFVYHKFLPSDVRDANRAIRNRYQVIKSKCYFALKHGLRTNSFYDVCRSLATYVDGSRTDYLWCVENGLLTQQDFEQFERDLHTAFDTALERFMAGTDRTRAPEWFAERQEPFLPFPTRRRATDKLHLCFLSQEYPPGPVNGIARFVHALATGLAAEGHLVRVLTRGEGHDRVDLEDDVWVHRVAVRDHPLPESLVVPSQLWSYSASLLGELRRVHAYRGVDLVQAPNWDSEIVAALLAGEFRTVVSLHTPLATVRQLEPEVAKNPEVEGMVELERFCLEHADALLANGAAVVEAIESRYGLLISRDRLAVVPHGMPDATPGLEPDRGGHGVEILFVGRLERRKGIDTLLASIPNLAREFSDLTFTLVGDDTIAGDDGVSYREAFERSEAGAALRDRVRFTGIVDDDELRRCYATCDVFVAPSRFESFGLVLVEAMMFGKPVVAGDNPGMRNVVEDGGNGYLVSPDDPSVLCAAIASLVRSPEQRGAFGRRSRELFEQRFSARRMVYETNRFYDRLLGRATAPETPSPALPPVASQVPEAVPPVSMSAPVRASEPDQLTREGEPVSGPAGEVRELAARVLNTPVDPGGVGPIVIDTLTEKGADELVVSYDSKFQEAIGKGESIYLPMTPLQQAAHERKMELLDELPVGDLTDKVCVDFGVGSWGFACVYPRLQRCRFAIGIDISAEAIRESARVSASGAFPYGDRFAYLTSRGDDIQLRDGSVDLLFTGECIEHVENTDAFLDEIHRVLVPSGLLVLTTPNADSYLHRLGRERYCVGAEHVSLMGFDELCRYLAPRFEILEVKGFASSLHHSWDDDISDPEFIRSWVTQFADQPQLAPGLVLLARRRDGHQPSRYEQWRFHHANDAVAYEGDWRVATIHDALTAHLALDGGRGSLRLRFPGTDLLVFLWTHAWSGHALVVVDGQERALDLYSAESGFRRLHFAGLLDGQHELRITQTGDRNERSYANEVIFHEAISYRRAEGEV